MEKILEQKMKALADMLDKYSTETRRDADGPRMVKGSYQHGQMIGGANAQRNAARWIRTAITDAKRLTKVRADMGLDS